MADDKLHCVLIYTEYLLNSTHSGDRKLTWFVTVSDAGIRSANPRQIVVPSACDAEPWAFDISDEPQQDIKQTPAPPFPLLFKLDSDIFSVI